MSKESVVHKNFVKTISVIFAIGFAAFCVSCNDNKNDGKTDYTVTFPETLTVYNATEDFVYNYGEDDYSDLTEKLADLKAAVEKQSISAKKCKTLSSEASEAYNALSDAADFAQLIYYADVTNFEAQERYSSLQTKKAESNLSYNAVLSAAADTKYRKVFFEGMTDKEIEDKLASLSTDEKVTEYTAVANEAIAKYNLLDNTQKLSAEYVSPIYADLVNAENSLAECYGKENYMEYSYTALYHRDFTPADTKGFNSSVMENFVPTYEALYDKLTELSSVMTMEERQTAASYTTMSCLSDEGKNVLDGFYKSLGDDIYSLYKTFCESGILVYAEGDNAYAGAYTSYLDGLETPYIYISKSYDNLKNFVHEFGHYCAFYLNYNENISYELAETQSQGAEWLYYYYVANNINLTENQKEFFVDYMAYTFCGSITYSSIVGAAEVDIFSLDEVTAETDFTAIVQGEYSALSVDTCNKLLGAAQNTSTPEKYFYYVAVTRSGYYISYALSALSAMEFYALAGENYEQATKTYYSLLYENTGYVSALTKLNIYSPFEEETFTALNNAFVKSTD